MALLTGLSNETVIEAGTAAGVQQKKLQEDLNQFLNLLVTQLKNQDPLDPLDANEFTSQLVQFASVEQQIYQNAHLEKLVGLEEQGQVPAMVSYIGHTVEAKGQYFSLENEASEFTYELDQAADLVVFTIKDGAGKVVFSGNGQTIPGKHALTWDGMGLDGGQNPDGTYSVSVTAFDRAKNLLNVAQTGFGRVTGASAATGEPTLFLRDIEVPLTGILSIRESAASVQ
jgi:flagellar basal-body rod modification protein FlgD